jgi:hypothetical protein
MKKNKFNVHTSRRFQGKKFWEISAVSEGKELEDEKETIFPNNPPNPPLNPFQKTFNRADL